MRLNFILALIGLFIGLGIALSGYFISQTMLNQRVGANTASVKGLSERIVQADTATWGVTFKVTSRDLDNVAGAFDTAREHSARIMAILTDAGFEPSEVYAAPLKKEDDFRTNRDGEVIDRFYHIRGRIDITTRSPAKVEPARGPVLALASDGLDLRETFVDYRFTGLNEIKPDMLREATENARIAANEFAANADVRVGGIQFASQGGFQIRSATGDGPGHDEVDKLVRVVTTITFYLEN